MFLGNLVLEEGGQEQNRADGRIPGVVHLAAVGGSVLGVLILVVAPGSRNVGKRSFHGIILSPGIAGQQKSGCLPAACVHIVIDLYGVVIADRGGRVEQHCKQILFHIADLRGVFLHTVHDKSDMLAIQLQEPGAHDFMGKVAASDPSGFTFGTNGLHHQLHNLVQVLTVGRKLSAQIVIPLLTSCRFNLQNSPCKLKSGGDRQRESLGCFPSPETKMPADLKDQLAFLFAHKENALLRFYKYNKYTKHNSIPTKHLKIMFFDKVH